MEQQAVGKSRGTRDHPGNGRQSGIGRLSLVEHALCPLDRQVGLAESLGTTVSFLSEVEREEMKHSCLCQQRVAKWAGVLDRRRGEMLVRRRRVVDAFQVGVSGKQVGESGIATERSGRTSWRHPSTRPLGRKFGRGHAAMVLYLHRPHSGGAPQGADPDPVASSPGSPAVQDSRFESDPVGSPADLEGIPTSVDRHGDVPSRRQTGIGDG